ncbi:MAG: D-Ala-D-Ala carboxypeptidase family metallohydrolase, partial [Lachnospiraceae bacterium]|nr:D-Ala-D-Ala carboxypeptidase family metallohydrolase [Lachnospiraceae bacterium]
YNWNQNEFDALVSFAFNIGSIDLLTSKGTRTKERIAEKMLLYVKGGGKVLPGLLKRRKEEQALFLTPVNTGGQMKPEQSHSSILKAGSKGETVKQFQQKLATIGYTPGTADGVFGAKTKAAVIAFQKDAGLTQDGIVGAATLAALEEIKIYSLKADGNKAISANFKVKEFACKDKSDAIVLHESFVRDKLQKIRSHFNAAVTFNSAYRTPEHNRREGGAPNSYHIKGRAVDIVVKGKTPAEVARYAASIGIKGIIQYNSFVHVDSRAVKYWAKKNNNGKVTVVSNF